VRLLDGQPNLVHTKRCAFSGCKEGSRLFWLSKSGDASSRAIRKKTPRKSPHNKSLRPTLFDLAPQAGPVQLLMTSYRQPSASELGPVVSALRCRAMLHSRVARADEQPHRGLSTLRCRTRSLRGRAHRHQRDFRVGAWVCASRMFVFDACWKCTLVNLISRNPNVHDETPNLQQAADFLQMSAEALRREAETRRNPRASYRAKHAA
jgi:hypothetical protein